MSANTCVFTKQAITTKDGRTFGYDLVYRGTPTTGFESSTTQSARVLWEALSNPGPDSVVGPTHMFLSVDQRLLETDLLLLIPKDQGVVLLDASIKPTAIAIHMLEQLRLADIGIAINHFRGEPERLPLLKYANFVTIDIQSQAKDLYDLARAVRPYHLAMIAKNIAKKDDVSHCWDLGFHLYQGDGCARPLNVPTQSVPFDSRVIADILSTALDDQISLEAFCEEISRDLGFAHRMLTILNSEPQQGHKPFRSIAEAVLQMGRDKIALWADLLLLTQLAKPHANSYSALAMTRGRACRRLGERQTFWESNELYTLGLLSALPQFLGRSIESVMEDLPLAASLREALTGASTSDHAHILSLTLNGEVDSRRSNAQPSVG